MASLVVNQGLQRIGINASQASGFASGRFIQTMAVDDATGALVSANTKLNDGAGYSQEYDAGFDATPSRTNQSISHSTTIPTGSGNFTIRRVTLHDDTAANVTATSTSLVCGVDGQTLAKTADFTLTPTINLNYTSV